MTDYMRQLLSDIIKGNPQVERVRWRMNTTPPGQYNQWIAHIRFTDGSSVSIHF